MPGLYPFQLVAAGRGAGGRIGGLQGDGRRSGHPRRGGGSAPYCVAARAESSGAEQVRVGASWAIEVGCWRGAVRSYGGQGEAWGL